MEEFILGMVVKLNQALMREARIGRYWELTAVRDEGLLVLVLGRARGPYVAPKSKTATSIVDGILVSLLGRKGFDDWWYNADQSIRQEIGAELDKIVEEAIK